MEQVIVPLTIITSIVIIFTGSFFLIHPKKAIELFGRHNDRTSIFKIPLTWSERRYYKDFLFRHGFDLNSNFAKTALFEAMKAYELFLLDTPELTMPASSGHGVSNYQRTMRQGQRDIPVRLPMAYI
jgi:hypothetical protein